MKIAMIGHKDFPSRAGGVEVVVYELATRLARMGHSVTVFNRGKRKGSNHYTEEGVEVYRCSTSPKKSLNALLYSITATFCAIGKGYDVYHYHAIGPSLMLIVPHFLGKKTVSTVHGLNWGIGRWNRFASWYSITLLTTFNCSSRIFLMFFSCSSRWSLYWATIKSGCWAYWHCPLRFPFVHISLFT